MPDREVRDVVDRIIKEHEFFIPRPEQKQLDRFLCEYHSGLLLVTAGAGFGKTSLLANWITKQQDKNYFIAHHFFSQRDDATRSVAKAYQNLLWQLYEYFEICPGVIPDSEEGLRGEIYALLRERTARADLPLVIVLDGLDEAEKSFSPPFPISILPAHAYVIASAREGEEPEYLQGWDCTEEIQLGRLPRETIADWLKKAGEGKLATFAENDNFIAQFDEVTQGYPLYLHFLIEELIQAELEDVQAVLKSSPKGFANYVKQQFKQLAQIEKIQQRQEVQELFTLLSVALGSLSEDDIQELTNFSTWELAALPWQATRWFNIQAGYYNFSHPLLAQEFRGILRQEVISTVKKLIDYCSCWQQHHSTYALRHYADHLQDGKQWNELYDLARNSEFANAQREFLPNEPGLSLKTIQTALHCATDTDNAGVMAEFLLKHTHQLANAIAQESPLEALRAGSLSKALALVELYEPQIEPYILWHLLLAWELKETNQKVEANEILKQLLTKRLPRFNRAKITWQRDIATYLLAYVFDANPEICTKLSQCILDENDFSSMCLVLCNRGYSTEAFDTMRLQIENKLVNNSFNNLSEIHQIQEIAEIQAKRVSKDVALESLSKIADLLLTPGWELCFASEWANLASLEVNLGEEKLGKAHFDKAIDIAKKIKHQWTESQDFSSIIYHQKEAGKTNSLFLEDALELLQSEELQAVDTSGLYSRVKFSVEIAEIQALLSRLEDAQETLKKTQAFAEQIEDFEERMECFIDIGKGYVDIGRFDHASEIAKKTIEYHSLKQEGILPYLGRKQATEEKSEDQNQIDNREEIQNKNQAVVFDQLEAGESEEARTTLSLLLRTEPAQEIPLLKAWTLVEIAEVQLKAEATQSALSTTQAAAQFAEEIEDQFSQAQVLANLAELWAKLGSLQEASKALQRAFSIAREIRAKQEKKGEWSFGNPCSRIFATIAETQARIGNFDAALETFKMLIHNTLLKAHVLRVIAQEQSDLGAESLQQQKLKEMLAITYEKAPSDPFSPIVNNRRIPRVEVFCTLAIVRSIIGEQETALETLKYWREQAEERDKSKILANVAIAEIQIQGIETALKTLNSIDDLAWRIRVLWAVANSQFKCGLKQELLLTLNAACEAYDQLKDEKERSNAISMIARMRAMAGLSYQPIQLTEQILENREALFPTLARISAEAEDLQHFKQFLIPCAYYLKAAYEICICLAKLYPEQSAEIARVINDHC